MLRKRVNSVGRVTRVNRVSGGGVPAFSPASLPGYVDSPFSFAQLRASGKLWQDLAMTVPAVADGDPVRRAVCGGVNYDAPSDAARPLLWDEGGGKWSLSFDGIDDSLVAIVPATNVCTLGTCVQPPVVTSGGMTFASWADPTTFEIAGTVQLIDTPPRIRGLHRDVTFQTALVDTAGNLTAAGTLVVVGNGPTTTLYENGTLVGMSSNPSIVMTGISTRIGVGASVDHSAPTQVRILGLAACSTALGSTDLASLDAYLAALS